MFNKCGKEYMTRENLKRHINISHLHKRVIICPICNKKLLNSANMKEHRLIHSNAKPYQCPVCQKAFRHKSKLGCHKKTHES
jgi:uncharacterized Zn-finger protein